MWLLGSYSILKKQPCYCSNGSHFVPENIKFEFIGKPSISIIFGLKEDNFNLIPIMLSIFCMVESMKILKS